MCVLASGRGEGCVRARATALEPVPSGMRHTQEAAISYSWHALKYWAW